MKTTILTLTVFLSLVSVALGQGARTLLFDRTNLTVLVPETGFFHSNRTEIGKALRSIAFFETVAEMQAWTPTSTNDFAMVRHMSTTVRQETPREWTLTNALPAFGLTASHSVTSLTAGLYWVAEDSRSGVQRATSFGYVADDSTDCTTPLQNAIRFCLTNNLPELILPAGIGQISSVSITNNLLEGGLSIHGPEGVKAHLKARGTGTMISIADSRLITFHDLIIDGNSISTNLINLDGCTQVTIERNLLYRSAGDMITETGVQNYGHRISGNKFSVWPGKAIALEATSVTKQMVDNNTFDATGYQSSAIGLSMRYGVASLTSFNNVYQRLRIGIDNRGAGAGTNLRNLSLADYFEYCTEASIRLAYDGQITGFGIREAFFNVNLTTNQVAIIDGGSAQQVYGLEVQDYTVTPDGGLTMSVPNLAGTGWRINSAATDYATDFSWSTNYPVQFQFGNQSPQSVLVTNFSAAAAGTTNLSLVMFRVPDVLVVNPTDSNSAVTIAGSLPHGAPLTIKNIGTNGLVFQGYPITQNLEERFIFLNGTWARRVGPYLLDTGGTVRGSVTVTNGLTVGGAVSVTGNADFFGNVANPWGYMSYGTYGGTNIAVLAAKTGAVLGLMKDGAYYAFFGTNNGIRFDYDLTMAPNRGIYLGGVLQTNWPSGGGGGATNGTDVWIEGTQQTTFNLLDGAEIAGAKTGSNYTYSVVAGSLGTNKLTTAAYTSLVSRATHTGTQTASTISDFTAAAIAAAGLGWQPTNANLTTVSALTGGTSTNFLAGDGSFKQVTTNMIPGLVEALAVGGGGSGAYTNTTGSGAYVLADSPTVSGNWVFDELTVGTFTVATNLFSAEVAYGAGWNGSSNVPTRNAVYDEMELRAPKASPALTGDPTAPTATAGDADTSIATTAFTSNAVATATADTGVTAGTYTLSANGNTATVDAKGRITAIEDFDNVNDFDLVDEFIGPLGYVYFNPTANGGTTATGTTVTTLTNQLGSRYLMTSGSNQYPILVCAAPFKNTGMSYVQLAMRFYFPLLSTDADPWEFQMGIYDAATTTNRPANGAWIMANTNLGNANFFLCNGTNSTYNYVDTGIPMTATSWHDWTVRMTPSNSIAFYGSTSVATNSLNYPTSTYMSLFSIRMSRFMHTTSAQRFIYVDNGRISFRSGPGR